MKVIHNGVEKTARQDDKGRWIVDSNTLASIDGVNLRSGFTIPAPTYTREQILDMLVVELDALGVELGIELTGLKADKQTAILEALGL